MDTRTIQHILRWEWLPVVGDNFRKARIEREEAAEYQKMFEAQLHWLKAMAGAPHDLAKKKLHHDAYWRKRWEKRSNEPISLAPVFPFFGTPGDVSTTARPIEEIIEAIPDKRIPKFDEDTTLAELLYPTKRVLPSISQEEAVARITRLAGQWYDRIDRIGLKHNWSIEHLEGIELEDVFLHLLGNLGNVQASGYADDPDIQLVFFVHSPRFIPACIEKDCDSSNSIIIPFSPNCTWQGRGLLNFDTSMRIARWFDCELKPVADEWRATFMLDRTCSWQSKNPSEAILKALLQARILEIQTGLSAQLPPFPPNDASSEDLVLVQ